MRKIDILIGPNATRQILAHKIEELHDVFNMGKYSPMNFSSAVFKNPALLLPSKYNKFYAQILLKENKKASVYKLKRLY